MIPARRPLCAILAVGALALGCAAPEREPPEDPSERVAEDRAGERDPAELERLPDAEPRDVPPSRYGNPDRYEALGRTYEVMDPEEVEAGLTQRGYASWYGSKFHGRRTSSGTPYDMYAMTAAHRELPLPTWVEVTNLDNDRQAVVKVNDRGPFVDPHERIIDLSYAAAVRLGMAEQGTAPVEIRVVTPERGADEPAASNAETAAEDGSAADGAAEAQGIPDRERPEPEAVLDEAPADAEPGSGRPEGAAPVSGVEATLEGLDSLGHLGLHLQAGAYGDRANAERVRDMLAEETTLTPRIDELEHDGGTLHRVRLGPITGLEELEQAEGALQAAGIESMLVTP